jgi:hypothetical protein
MERHGRLYSVEISEFEMPDTHNNNNNNNNNNEINKLRGRSPQANYTDREVANFCG